MRTTAYMPGVELGGVNVYPLLLHGAHLGVLVMVFGQIDVRGEIHDTTSPDPHRWQSDIAAFEDNDDRERPPQRANLFVGSSSIRGWDLARDFPAVVTVNRRVFAA